MRNIIYAIVAILLCSGTFYYGLKTGESRSTNTTSMVFVGSNVLEMRTLLGLVRKGNSDGAEKYINSSIDADLIQLKALLGDSNDKALNARVKQTIAIVARDRAEHPASKNQALPEVDEKVNSILGASGPRRSDEPANQ